MIVYIGLRVVDCCLCIDGKRYVGDQGQSLKDQQAQESFDQDKYSMGSSLFPNNFNHTIHIACVFLLSIS